MGFEQCPAYQRLMDPVGSGGGMQRVGGQACKYLQVAGRGRMLMEPPRENPQTSHPEGRVTKWSLWVAQDVVATQHRDTRSVSSAAQCTKSRVSVCS